MFYMANGQPDYKENCWKWIEVVLGTGRQHRACAVGHFVVSPTPTLPLNPLSAVGVGYTSFGAGRGVCLELGDIFPQQCMLTQS